MGSSLNKPQGISSAGFLPREWRGPFRPYRQGQRFTDGDPLRMWRRPCNPWQSSCWERYINSL